MGGGGQLPQPGRSLPGQPQLRNQQAGQAGGWAWERQASSQVAMATETKRGADERPGTVPYEGPQAPTALREARPLSRTCVTRAPDCWPTHFQGKACRSGPIQLPGLEDGSENHSPGRVSKEKVPLNIQTLPANPKYLTWASISSSIKWETIPQLVLSPKGKELV